MTFGNATSQIAVLATLNAGQTFHTSQLVDETKLDRKLVTSATTRLVRHGLIERTERGVFQITKEGKEHLESGKPLNGGPKKKAGKPSVRMKSLRQRLWNAMLQITAGGPNKAFTLQSLFTIALHDGEEKPHTYTNSQYYLRLLTKTGFIERLNRREPGTRPGSNGFFLYKITRNTGELAPIVRIAQKDVYDPNTKESYSWNG